MLPAINQVGSHFAARISAGFFGELKVAAVNKWQWSNHFHSDEMAPSKVRALSLVESLARIKCRLGNEIEIQQSRFKTKERYIYIYIAKTGKVGKGGSKAANANANCTPNRRRRASSINKLAIIIMPLFSAR